MAARCTGARRTRVPSRAKLPTTTACSSRKADHARRSATRLRPPWPQDTRVTMATIMVGLAASVPAHAELPEPVRAMIDASGRPIRLEIDGGVKADNIGEIAAAGADTFVAGSAIFNADDYADVIGRMKSAVAGVR